MGWAPECDGRAFLVTEFVDGLPLLAHLERAGWTTVNQGLRLVKEACRGLALVHAQGGAHRDLNPDNVLIDRAGVVRLVDFGFGTGRDLPVVLLRGLPGTLTYLAPEVLHGDSTPAADVYGLGLLMYQLFTGGGPHLTASWPTGSQEHLDEYRRVKEALVF